MSRNLCYSTQATPQLGQQSNLDSLTVNEMASSVSTAATPTPTKRNFKHNLKRLNKIHVRNRIIGINKKGDIRSIFNNYHLMLDYVFKYNSSPPGDVSFCYRMNSRQVKKVSRSISDLLYCKKNLVLNENHSSELNKVASISIRVVDSELTENCILCSISNSSNELRYKMHEFARMMGRRPNSNRMETPFYQKCVSPVTLRMDPGYIERVDYDCGSLLKSLSKPGGHAENFCFNRFESHKNYPKLQYNFYCEEDYTTQTTKARFCCLFSALYYEGISLTNSGHPFLVCKELGKFLTADDHVTQYRSLSLDRDIKSLTMYLLFSPLS